MLFVAALACFYSLAVAWIAILSDTDFSSLALNAELLANLGSLGYLAMTPIQQHSLPPILAGRDVIAQGQTGSGKTAAFALGLLQKLRVKRFRVQSLVLCPTRELADQVAREIRRLARSIHNIKVLTLCGGVPVGPQIGSLEHGAHIIVGTPGRVEDHLRKRTLSLAEVDTLVLDEADRMLDMGFEDSLQSIVAQIPPQRQTMLFSATFPAGIKSMAAHVMRDPVRVEVESTHDDDSIAQHFYRIEDDQQRASALRLLLLHFRPQSAVVFCNTKREVQEIADALRDDGFSVLALHGDLEQRDRDQRLVRFANGSATVLVATDVAARGLDIDSLDLVVNYQLAHDPEQHVHRIGRTGRAGGKGLACSLFAGREVHRLVALGNYLGVDIVDEALPPTRLLTEVPVPVPVQAQMVTLLIDAGRKQKIRPGDIVGALTGTNGIGGKQIGKIAVFDTRSYVAVESALGRDALMKLVHGKLKGRSVRARLLRD